MGTNHEAIKILICAILLLLNTSLVLSQVPLNLIGSNSPGLKWKQINTDQVKVIFRNRCGRNYNDNSY